MVQHGRTSLHPHIQTNSRPSSTLQMNETTSNIQQSRKDAHKASVGPLIKYVPFILIASPSTSHNSHREQKINTMGMHRKVYASFLEEAFKTSLCDPKPLLHTHRVNVSQICNLLHASSTFYVGCSEPTEQLPSHKQNSNKFHWPNKL